MKKNSFLQGAMVATISIILVKVIGVLYVIPFHAIVGESGGSLYGYAYNIYQIFLGISSAGLPFAISKLIGEYDALGYSSAKQKAYKIIKQFTIVISLILFLILFFGSGIFSKIIVGQNGNVSDVSYVIKMISFAILVVPFLSVTKGFLQGHKYITPGSVSQIIEQIVRVSVIIIGSYLSIKVFKTDLKTAIGISAFAAFVGGFFASLYLFVKIKRSNVLTRVSNNEEIPAKEIIKKLISYAIPFIITGVTFNIYNFADMVLVRRTLADILMFSIADVESITAIYSTWASKLLAIVISISTGLITSLLPNIIQSYTKNNIDDVSNKINKSLQIILIIIFPITIFLSFMSNNIWILFYGTSKYGPLIFKVFIYTAIATSIFSLISNVLQGISKYKIVYLITIGGLLLNIVLDVPLMLLFNKYNIFPVYGASISTIFSMIIASLTGFYYLHKKEKISFKETFKMLPKSVISLLIFIITLIIVKNLLPVNNNRLIQIPILLISGIIIFGIYFIINYYNGNLKKIFGNFKKGDKI